MLLRWVGNDFSISPTVIPILLAFLITFILINLIGALAPPLQVDDLKYHFAIPKRYMNEHLKMA